MHMIWHNYVAIYKMPFTFEMITPFIYNIIARNFINKRQPIMAGKGYKEHTVIVWYGVFYRHRMKL